MSRLVIPTNSEAQNVVEGLYKDLERRIIASPPGLCPVDLTAAFLKMCHAQTCGKCVPCREGNRQMYMILHRFANGLATEKDFERMERLSFTMATASSCGLGQSACTALDSCLKHRREEFQAHIKGICPVCLNSRKYGDQYAY